MAPSALATSGAALGMISSGVLVATKHQVHVGGVDARLLQRGGCGSRRVRVEPLARRGYVARPDSGTTRDPVRCKPQSRLDL